VKIQTACTHIRFATFAAGNRGEALTRQIARTALILAHLIVSTASYSNATAIVILRGPRGTKMIVAADSEFAIAGATPAKACKIVQVERRYWTAISGLASEPATHFDAFAIVAAAASHHPNSLDDIAIEARDRTLAVLPASLKHERKVVGKKAFWQEHEDGFDAQEEAFWGVEDGTVRLVYVQFVLHRKSFGRLRLSAAMHTCPGDLCPDPASAIAVFLGHHKIIDKFRADNADWAARGTMESVAKQFVQMEIESEPDCHCSAPVAILRMDRSGRANWVDEMGPSCQMPH
jgi:hypothetical protein